MIFRFIDNFYLIGNFNPQFLDYKDNFEDTTLLWWHLTIL